jgi:hypothetical protein
MITNVRKQDSVGHVSVGVTECCTGSQRISSALIDSELLRFVTSVDADVIRNIIDGDPLLAIVNKCIDPDVAAKMANALLAAEWSSYSAQSGAANIGTMKDFNSLFECLEDTACTGYFDRAPHCMLTLNRALFPFANPAEWVLQHFK